MSLIGLWLSVVNNLIEKYPEIMGKIDSSEISNKDKIDFVNLIMNFDNETDPHEMKGILDTFQFFFEDQYPDLFVDIEDNIKNLYLLTGLEVNEW